MSTNQFGLPVSLPGAKAPTRIWSPLHEIEHDAQTQIRNTAALPWVHGVAVMPDVHTGYGVTIGSVIAMKQAVSPSAAGVDLGCGMNAVKTNINLSDLPDDLGPIRRQLEAVTPVGFNAYDGTAPILRRESKLSARFDNLFGKFADLRADGIDERQGKALSQCGTLGGGNHFQELCVDTDNFVWLMLHSGSRNIGKELAERHIAKAKGLEWNSDLPDRNLAVFLHKDADGHVYPEWTDYLHDLYWAQDYAALSRQIMMASFKDVVRAALPQVTFEDEISCHHNYVSEETYDGRDLVITRKGAIAAHAGQLGVIPGSMGTGSFIVRGLGNESSYNSASHGAGRKMSRGKAKKVFTVEDLAAQTAGVECRKDAGVLDEIPGAYKDLNQVIAYESDLVEPVARLETLLCVKG